MKREIPLDVFLSEVEHINEKFFPIMYIPNHFREAEPANLFKLVEGNPLGTLITQGAQGLNANHIPFDLKRAKEGNGGSLFSHLARANPALVDLGQAKEVLIIFQGANGYISPSWYETKKESGKVVPTWNYSAVHIWGKPEIHDDPIWLASHLDELTRNHEEAREKSWQVSDAPDDFIEKSIKAIVGVSISISRIEGKWKMSQNRNEADLKGVLAGLESEPGELPQAMRDFYHE